MDVSARSPPESISSPLIFLWGKLTFISIPSSTSSSSGTASSPISTDNSSSISTFLRFSGLTTTSSACPPPNINLKNSSNCELIRRTPSRNSISNFSVSSLISVSSESADCSRSTISRSKNESLSATPQYSLSISSLVAPPSSSRRILNFSSCL